MEPMAPARGIHTTHVFAPIDFWYKTRMTSRLTYAAAGAVLADKVIEWGGEEAAVEYLTSHLANGGSMQDFCMQNGLNWGLVAAWIRNSPERNARFQQAMMDRDAWRKERLLDGWWKTAESVPEEAVTHGDVHKARESLAKAEGVFTEQKVQVDTNITIVHESA